MGACDAVSVFTPAASATLPCSRLIKATRGSAQTCCEEQQQQQQVQVRVECEINFH